MVERVCLTPTPARVVRGSSERFRELDDLYLAVESSLDRVVRMGARRG